MFISYLISYIGLRKRSLIKHNFLLGELTTAPLASKGVRTINIYSKLWGRINPSSVVLSLYLTYFIYIYEFQISKYLPYSISLFNH